MQPRRQNPITASIGEKITKFSVAQAPWKKQMQWRMQMLWRKQIQVVGLFLLVLVFGALVASIYLNISSQAAAVGRDIQMMQTRIDELSQEIEDLQSQLAFVRSAEKMEQRALDMGFIELESAQQFSEQSELDAGVLLYLTVPGYIEKQPAVLAPYMPPTVMAAPVNPAEYNETLFEWLRRQAHGAFALEVLSNVSDLP